MSLDLRTRVLLAWGWLHIGERIRQRAVARAARPYLRAPMRVLDAGCGRGDLARTIARRHAVHVDAVDIAPDTIAFIAARVRATGDSRVTPRIADVTTADFESGYGMVYTVDMLEHVRDPAAVMRRCVALLAPGGVCIAHVPALVQRRWFARFEHYHQDDHEREGFAPEEIAEMAARAGLEVCALRATFGPPGALAWECFHALQHIARPLVLLAYPFLALLIACDGWFCWKRGNGVLLVAQKPL